MNKIVFSKIQYCKTYLTTKQDVAHCSIYHIVEFENLNYDVQMRVNLDSPPFTLIRSSVTLTL